MKSQYSLSIPKATATSNRLVAEDIVSWDGISKMLTITVQDGALVEPVLGVSGSIGDHDGLRDGRIVDPGAPAFPIGLPVDGVLRLWMRIVETVTASLPPRPMALIWISRASIAELPR